MVKTMSIVGFGNLGSHLYRMFAGNDGYRVVQIIVPANRHREKIGSVQFVSWEAAEETAVYFLAVPDKKIAETASRISNPNALVIHSSGAHPLAVIPQQKRGVLYPLQSFTKAGAIDYERIPFFIEASDADSRAFLEELTAQIAKKGQYLCSRQRLTLHLAAVFSNNFVNQLLYLSQQILAATPIDFKQLAPLVDTTVQKAFAQGPKQSQTGPARRKDWESVKKHLDLMGDKKLRHIYHRLTESIIETHEKEL